LNAGLEGSGLVEREIGAEKGLSRGKTEIFLL